MGLISHNDPGSSGPPAAQAPGNGSVINEQLALLYAPIAEDLQAADRVLREKLKSQSPFVEELTSRVQLYRGKRLRPALLLLTANAVGEVTQDHHVLAAVVEMIHAATLVHDDVLDDADVRRHVTTVNAEWGNEASVLLGDYLFTHSFHLAASLDSTLACRVIGDATNQVCEGELHQVSRRGCFELSEHEYLTIISGKTAELLACCGKLGAHYASATSEQEEAMTHFGRNLGIAFQISDDLIDLLSSENAAGKSIGTDLLKQKPTLPLIRFRQAASDRLVEECRLLFDDPDQSQNGKVLRLLQQTDALQYARQRAQDFADDAASRLQCLSPSPARSLLHKLTELVVDRSA